MLAEQKMLQKANAMPALFNSRCIINLIHCSSFSSTPTDRFNLLKPCHEKQLMARNLNFINVTVVIYYVPSFSVYEKYQSKRTSHKCPAYPKELRHSLKSFQNISHHKNSLQSIKKPLLTLDYKILHIVKKKL